MKSASSSVAINTISGGYELIDKNNYREIYDTAGKLLSTIEPNGFTLNYTYNNQTGFLESVSNNKGQSLAITTNATGYITQIETPDNNVIRYSYYRGRLVSVTYPDLTPGDDTDNPSRIYHYQTNSGTTRRLVGITDERGIRFTTWGYDGSGRAISSEHAGANERFLFNYASSLPQTTVTTPLGKQRVYHYQVIDGVRKVTQVQGLPSNNCAAANQNYSYYSNGLIHTKTDWSGNLTRYTYNARDLEISRTEAEGTPQQRVITTEWHPTLRLPSAINEPGLRREFDYNANGQKTAERQIAEGETRTTTYTYNSDGLLERVNGPRSDVLDETVYEYDTQRNLIAVTNALGHITTYTDYNAAGQPQHMTDANGMQTRLVYHPRGWLLSSTIVHPSGDSTRDLLTQYAYDAVGQLTAMTLPDGQQLSYTYDAARRLTAIENQAGERQSFTHDAAGNPLTETIFNSDSTLVFQITRAYDELNRVMDVLGNADQHQHLDYDVNDNVVASTDGRGNTTQQQFDALHRVVSSLDPYLNNSDLAYDAQDRLTQFTDARGLSTHYTYNGFGELTALQSPDTGLTTYGHDAAGNRIASTDARGHQVLHTYDALNRLTTISYPASPTENVSYTYDDTSNGNHGVGRLTRIDDASGSIHYRYDYLGHLARKVEQRAGGAVLTTAYGYDAFGRLSQMTYPSGRIIHYTRDSQGRIARITTQSQAGLPEVVVVDNLGYQPFGPLSAFDFGNGIAHRASFDLDYRLERLQQFGNAVLMDRQYSYDENNNITGIDFLDGSQLDMAFGYDSLDRLDSASGPFGALDYDYDEVGNRLFRSREQGGSSSAEVYVYAATSNRLDSVSRDINGTVSARDFSYDANGNRVGERNGAGETRLDYNHANRPSGWQSAGLDVQYQHNALGQRTEKTLLQGQAFSLNTDAGLYTPARYLPPANSSWASIALALYGTEAAATALSEQLGALGYSPASASIAAADLPASLNLALPDPGSSTDYPLNSALLVDVDTTPTVHALNTAALSGGESGPISYSTLNGLSESNGTLSKTAADNWGDGNFHSSDSLPAGTDGWIDYQLGASIGAASLGLAAPGDSIYNIPFRFWIEGGVVSVYEGGTWIDTGSFPVHQAGDVLRIARQGSTVQFFYNGSLLYTSAQVSTQTLVAKGFFYHQGASATVQASFAPGSSGAAHYTVQAGDTWESIAALLYGSAGTADEVALALGNPALVAGSELSGFPAQLSDDEASTPVPAHYPVPAQASWASLADTLYGSSALAAALESALGSQYTLTEGESLLASDLPAVLVLHTPPASTDYALISAALSTTAVVPSEHALNPQHLSGNGAGPLSYTTLNGLIENSGTLSKTAADNWGDGNFHSSDSLPAGTDGWIDYQLGASIGAASLGLAAPGDSIYNIPFRFWIEGGVVSVYEGGTWIDTGSFPVHQAGDVLRIARQGSTVQFFYNGSLLYTSAQVSTQTLVAKGFFYHQGASATVQASFAPGGSGEAYYAVQAGDSWDSIATLLYGSAGAADELAAHLGDPTLVAGGALHNLPASLTDDEAIATVPAYYAVPADATWASVGNALYGSEAAARELQSLLGASHTLTEGESLPASALPLSLTVIDTLPPADFALLSAAILPEAFEVPAASTWASLALTLYGSAELADALQAALSAEGYTLTEGLPIARQDLPGTLGGVNTTATRLAFVYDEAGQLIAIEGDAANDDQEWIYLGNTLVAAVINNELHYVHNDHLMTPQKITDAQQNVVWAVVEQTPFGEVVVNEDVDRDGVAVVFNARFPGQYFDLESGTSYNYFRTYDASLGRYVQSDPIGLGDGPNTYTYVRANPITRFDPDGKATIVLGPAAVGAGLTVGLCYLTGTCQRIVDALGDLLNQNRDSGIEGSDENLQRDIEREANNSEYHNRCNEPEPPNFLNECDRARWRLRRAQDCRDLRNAMTRRWYGGVMDEEHARHMEQIERQIENAESAVRANCRDECL